MKTFNQFLLGLNACPEARISGTLNESIQPPYYALHDAFEDRDANNFVMILVKCIEDEISYVTNVTVPNVKKKYPEFDVNLLKKLGDMSSDQTSKYVVSMNKRNGQSDADILSRLLHGFPYRMYQDEEPVVMVLMRLHNCLGRNAPYVMRSEEKAFLKNTDRAIKSTREAMRLDLIKSH